MKNIPVPTFTTERLILKAVTEADIPAYTKYFVDYEIIGNLVSSVPWPYPENGVEEYVKTVIIPKQGNGRWTWGIFLKDNLNELIGMIEMWVEGKPEHRGFWLGRPFWGQGIMTEATIPVTDFAFDELNFKTIRFNNALGNERSRRIKEKAGAKLLYIEPEEFNNPQFTEVEVWELTAANWHKFGNKA